MDIISQYHKLQISRWHIRVIGNPVTSMTDFNHFYYHRPDEEFGDPTPKLSSPHINVLEKQDVSRAKVRLDNILRLVRGINIICESQTIYPSSDEITYIKPNGSHERFYDLTDSYDIDLIIEELNNPFDNRVTSLLQEIGFVESEENDYFNLLVINPLLREAVTLFMLSEENPLNLLINTYKIMDNIKSEYNLSGPNGSLVTNDGSPISHNLLNAINTLSKHSRYINNKDAAGYLSRHGESNWEPPKKKPTIKEIREDLIEVIRLWLDHESFLNYKRRYY